MITFKKEVVDERRTAILSSVGRWRGVLTAAPLKRDGSERFRRFSFVRVQDEHAEQVADALRSLPEIEDAEIAPRRGLASV